MANAVENAAHHAVESAEEFVRKVWTHVHFSHLPSWLQDNDYLHHWHRPPLPSFSACFKSIFRLVWSYSYTYSYPQNGHSKRPRFTSTTLMSLSPLWISPVFYFNSLWRLFLYVSLVTLKSITVYSLYEFWLSPDLGVTINWSISGALIKFRIA